MSPTAQIVLFWLGFAAGHLVLSSVAVRTRLVASLGRLPFLGLYSAVAFAFFVPLVSTYFAHKHAGAVLWGIGVGPALRWIIYAGMGVAFVLVVASLLRPSPAGVVPGSSTPYGVYRITRHPQNMGIALFGLLHLLPNGSAADLAFFGGFALFGVVGSWHQDRRKLALGAPGFAAFYARTPFWPFTGPETLQGLRELSPAAVFLGVGLTLLVRHFHPHWFGG
ncbi:MAG TPA: hypothetical protein DEP35_04875 [Deltaproteobacteria bacterium]|nr:hypothetical protein [Deltaproteobacteria bacterium]